MLFGGLGGSGPLAKRFKGEVEDVYGALPDAPADPAQVRTLTVHVNGYKQPCKVTVARDCTVTLAIERVLAAQLAHPNAIAPGDFARVVVLTEQPNTMNTSCKFNESDVLRTTHPGGGGPLRMFDHPNVGNVYLYLLCPEISLVTERGPHRRLAKRDAGVCEAHRGQSVRAHKKSMEVLGITGAGAGVVAGVVGCFFFFPLFFLRSFFSFFSFNKL
jgi:hypothetical protein